MKVLASKFYLVRELEVHPELGAFSTAMQAERAISIRQPEPDGTSAISRNLQFVGYRPVSGRLILNARVPYTIGGADA